MSNTAIIHAYRHLYRGLLQAVQYSVPARFIGRDQLRSAFRQRGGTFDEEGVKRTIWFLKAAAKETGLEHKIVKNLLRVAYARTRKSRPLWKPIVRGLNNQDGARRCAAVSRATRLGEIY